MRYRSSGTTFVHRCYNVNVVIITLPVPDLGCLGICTGQVEYIHVLHPEFKIGIIITISPSYFCTNLQVVCKYRSVIVRALANIIYKNNKCSACQI
jgi:hypothetical protein